MNNPHVLHLYVNDIPRATEFYLKSLDGMLTTQPNQTHPYLCIAKGQFLIKLWDSKLEPLGEQKDRNRTPRLELIVEDIQASIQKFLVHGGKVLTQVQGKQGNNEYVQVLDPFGYIWAFSK